MRETGEKKREHPTRVKTRIILDGSRKMLVENYTKIIRFEPECVLIQCSKKRLKIEGRGLWIEHYDCYDIMIQGEIESFAFQEVASV